MTKSFAIALGWLSGIIHADITDPESWGDYRLPDGSRLKFGLVRRASLRDPAWETQVTQLSLCKSDSSETVLWERGADGKPGEILLTHPTVDIARRFGTMYCIVLSNTIYRDSLEYLRIDVSRTPPSWLAVRADRASSKPTLDVAPVTIENEMEFSYLPQGADKVLFHVYDNGHVTRNGTPFNTWAYLNGKNLGVVTEDDEARRVWALGSSGHASGNRTGSEATGPLAALAEATGIRRLPGGWPLLATFAACLAGAASWLLFRARQRRNKQGQRTENGG